jgi:uncharacterized paraquat-inducible protein A
VEHPSGRSIKRAPVSGEILPGRARPRRAAADIDEGPSPEDLERLDTPTRACPECRKQVYDDAEVCYHCGHAMTAQDTPASSRWVLITVAVLLAAFVVAYLLR